MVGRENFYDIGSEDFLGLFDRTTVLFFLLFWQEFNHACKSNSIVGWYLLVPILH